MQPLISTAGMKEGTQNAVDVLMAIPRFLQEHTAGENVCTFSMSTQWLMLEKNIADYIRCVGLVTSKAAPMLADSPDGILGYCTTGDIHSCAAIEVKTMTSPATIDNAKALWDKDRPLSKMSGIRSSELAENQFKKLVSTPEYRLQCIHHVVILGLNRVIFIVAKRSRNGVGEIIYAVILEFTEFYAIITCLSWIAFVFQHSIGLDEMHLAYRTVTTF